MKKIQLRFRKAWHMVGKTRRSQAAEMVIAPWDVEGGRGNRHNDSDQWLLVVAGTGSACLEGRRMSLKPGTLLLIEKGEEHEIRNTGDVPLWTLNFFGPPAYE
jgi:mannose-6-phosphate isomerase-like protein (cupin superfamily)